jgi:DNA-binding NarL/FixJ family response regulator
MRVEVVPVRIAVLGPPDLLVTALVAALGTRGVEAERLPLTATVRDSAAFRHGGSGLLIVDIDAHNPSAAVRDATEVGLAVLVIGSDSNRERAVAAIAAGAVAWIHKASSLDALVDTVRAVAAGRLQMSDRRRAAWLAEYRDTHESVRADRERLGQLSPREREVLQLVADGLRAADIANVLFLSIATVRSHIRSILLKLGVNSQQQAADVYRVTSRRLERVLGTGSDR